MSAPGDGESGEIARTELPPRSAPAIPAVPEPAGVEERLVKYLNDLGPGVLGRLEKKPGEGVSFAIGGDLHVDPARLRTDLEALLSGYDRARIQLEGGEIRMALLKF